MAIQASDPPAAAVEAVKRAVALRAGNPTYSRSKLAAANPNAVVISMPHRIAYLPLDRIRGAADLGAAARPGNWRFLIQERRPSAGDAGTEEFVAISAATMVRTAEGYELGELNEGPFVAETEQAIRRAEKLPEVREGRFEALLLVVPAVHVVALWLQHRDAGADLLLTMQPSNPALASDRPISPEAFLDTIHQLALDVPSNAATAG